MATKTIGIFTNYIEMKSIIKYFIDNIKFSKIISYPNYSNKYQMKLVYANHTK
jgi:hypothetical protein